MKNKIILAAMLITTIHANSIHEWIETYVTQGKPLELKEKAVYFANWFQLNIKAKQVELEIKFHIKMFNAMWKTMPKQPHSAQAKEILRQLDILKEKKDQRIEELRRISESKKQAFQKAYDKNDKALDELLKTPEKGQFKLDSIEFQQLTDATCKYLKLSSFNLNEEEQEILAKVCMINPKNEL